NVVDADSSQLEAIRMAKSGKSFVLQGPPGTGKSQTITNIIAECLSDGKKVLFVSEKLAALNVVYEKLKAAGLSEFCLELHSHKASKKNVISDLCHTLRTTGSAVSSRANSEIMAKIKSQEQLDEYVYELHAKRPLINKSLYALYTAHASYRNAPDVKFTIDGIDSKGEDYFNAISPLLEQYVDYIPSVGRDYRENVWFGYCKSDSSYQTKNTLSSRFSVARDTLDRMAEIASELDDGFDIKPETVEEIRFYGDAFAFLASSETVTPALLDTKTCLTSKERVSAMLPLAMELTELGRTIETEYDGGVYKLDAKDAHTRLTRQFTGTFSRIFNSEYKKIILDLRLCRKNGKKPKYCEAVKAFDDLCRYQEKYSAFEELEKDIKDTLGKAYVGIKSDWGRISSDLKALAALLERSEDFGRIKELTANELYGLKKEFSVYSKSIKNIEGGEELDRIISVFDPKMLDFARIDFEAAAEKCVDCLENMDMLDNWCRFYCLLCELDDIGATPFINYSIDSKIDTDQIFAAYAK
ncbi:MAG: type III restriction endonuclease subunit R, partial [Clostridia bacterium]|nr:type III restriction endonuclease subunit R [Clostridia bacterium]